MDDIVNFPDLPKAIPIHYSSIGVNLHISLFDISCLNPLASGNKLFKLAPNVEYALEKGYSRILSFGGAFSNHIHALASFGQANGINTIGIIRGEPEYANNPTLKAAQACGMKLEFVDRKTYRLRHDPDFLKNLATKHPHTFIVPEGGTNQFAVEGCMKLATKINSTSTSRTTPIVPIDSIAVACGSGGTLAGLVCGLKMNQKVLGFPVVKDTSLKQKIDQLIIDRPHAAYQLIAADYGGFAKFDQQHLDFILDWLEQTDVLLDPIYTSKMCRRLIQMITENELKDSQHIGLVHTGGLQAWYGMRDKVITLGGIQAWKLIENKL